MYLTHKFLILTAPVFIAVILPACKTQEISLQSTEWKLVSLRQENVSMLQNPVTISFNEDGSRISGFGGCNRYFGSCNKSGNRISFSGLGATKMFCQETMSIEDNFLTVLSEVDSYAINDTTLLLKKGGSVVLEFTVNR